MLFTDFPLDDRLQRALATAGFVTPTPIQAAAIPVAMEGRDLVGTAQTGTGKTAAFVLPILQQLIQTPLESRKTRAVILAPTRELVEQILAVVRELGVHTNIRAVAVYGGVAMQPQTRALRNGVELVIACPGRLLDHIKRRNTDFRQLDCLVLDEADRMLDMGFLPSIEEIIGHLPVKRQTMLFSATFPKKLNAFVQQTLNNPARVEVDTAVAAQTVHHTLYQVKSGMKTAMLTTLLKQLAPESDSVLIFTQTRVMANQVAEHLHHVGMRADVLHAEKTQRARQDTLDQFRSGIFPYLVATDIAARGIDVTSISHVINFDLPSKADDYLHRIGRTGRMERAGHAISLVTRGDIRSLRDIERMLGKRMEVAQLEGGDFQQMSDAGPAPHPSAARPPKQHATSHAAPRPPKPRHQDEVEYPRRTPRNAAPQEPFQRADRPEERARRADTRSGRPPRRSYEPDTASAAPMRTERPEKRRVDTVPFPGADRPQRERDTDAPSTALTRKERRLKEFGPPTGMPRPERAERQYRDGDTASTDRRRRNGDTPDAPKRRERAADTRFGDATTSGASREERPRRKPFTGMASTAKHHRKHAGEKRESGEVAYNPRQHDKSNPVHHATSTHSARTKRPAGRRR